MAISITYFPHATTTDNEREIGSGWCDVERSELGKKQSADLRDEIKGRAFDVVFCSDLKRAVESANITFKGKAPIITDSRLRECNYGTYNGQPCATVEASQEKNITSPFPEGESYLDVKARVANFLEFLIEAYDGTSIAIVAHRVPQLALDVLLKGRTWEEACDEDWRKTKSWKAGWEYVLNTHVTDRSREVAL